MPDESNRGSWLRNLSGTAVAEKPAPAGAAQPTRSARGQAFRPGQLFHHFRLQSQLGRGATSTVYKAVDERNGTIVALKMLTLTEDWPDDLLDELTW